MHFAIREFFRKSRVEPLGEDGVEVGVGGDAYSACSQSARGRCEGRMTGPVQTATALSSLPCPVMITIGIRFVPGAAGGAEFRAPAEVLDNCRGNMERGSLNAPVADEPDSHPFFKSPDFLRVYRTLRTRDRRGNKA